MLIKCCVIFVTRRKKKCHDKCATTAVAHAIGSLSKISASIVDDNRVGLLGLPTHYDYQPNLSNYPDFLKCVLHLLILNFKFCW